LKRLQDIQKKRDLTNRDWQRIILRNVGRSLGWDMDAEDGQESSPQPVVETRQLWWCVYDKMQNPDYSNMLLLIKMEEYLEELMFERRQKYITKSAYEKIVSLIRWLVIGLAELRSNFPLSTALSTD